MPLPNPVIVIPGITANYLRDEYSLPPDAVWTVMAKDYERSSLHPDDVRYEAIEPSRVRPDQLYEVVYKDLIEELRHNLRESEDQAVPVFPFAYDWRQPLADTEIQLQAFVDEVIARTKLLRHYHNDAAWSAAPKVNLVGHSMGGLVIAGYLQRCGRDARVGKVTTLATPFRGSYEAVVKMLTGTANLGTSPPSSREREAARLTPALYHLFPRFAGALQTPDGLPPSFFNTSVWQPSILATLAEYVRNHGVTPGDAEQQAKTLFQRLLDQAFEHSNRIESFSLADAGLSPSDWLCVVGVNSVTRVRMAVTMVDDAPSFTLTSKDRLNEWTTTPDPVAGRLTGDGTVPFEGAVPPFLQENNLVCVTPDDFGYWEISDKALAALSGFHGILPGMDMLHRLIVLHFTGRTTSYNNVWGRAAPGVTSWAPPLPGLPQS